MIGNIITDNKGNPVDSKQKKLEISKYNPPNQVIRLLARAQTDYQNAWNLQHREFKEFDGYSLLERSKLDQETFSAYVGAEFIPEHKRWRWRGRKNTARNKLIGMLAHMLQAILFPTVHAQNPENEDDKMTARVMRIRVEEHLRKAEYKTKFLYMVLSALVNPAVFVEIEYLEAMQTIKERKSDGKIEVSEVIDTFLSGLNISIVPIDQILLADFYVPEIQKQPYIVRVNRIPWDTARKIYAKKYYIDGVDQFDFVEAGKTRVVIAGQENGTLFDIEWTEADQNAVQVLTFAYRDEDLEFDVVGGVFMGNAEDIYNSNPFAHRRMSLIGDEWKTIPIYKWAKSGFEPLDPTGRFTYYKSGSFKLYWDDKTQNQLHGYWMDGTALDSIKPILGTGIMKVDSTVVAPGAFITTPNSQSTLQPWSSNPNLRAAQEAMLKQEGDQSESTQDKIMNGATDPGITATASVQAQNQARVFLGVFGMMIADLIRQIGELTMDIIIQNETIPEIDATIPEALALKERVFLSKGKDRGKDITNKIIFTDALMGKKYTADKKKDYEFELWHAAGGEKSDQVIYHVDPYRFARTQFAFYIDPEDITQRAMGNDRQRKNDAFIRFTNPVVAPYVDMKTVVEDFVIDEYADGDPDRYKAKGNIDSNDVMGAIGAGQGGIPAKKSTPSPVQSPQGAMM